MQVPESYPSEVPEWGTWATWVSPKKVHSLSPTRTVDNLLTQRKGEKLSVGLRSGKQEPKRGLRVALKYKN